MTIRAILAAMLAASTISIPAVAAPVKPRVFVLTDIGNEPDDQMSMVRLMVYANELDIRGLVATTSTWQRAKVQPETIRAIVGDYGVVRPNLMKHAPGWPEADDLLGRITTAHPAYGLEGIKGKPLSSGAKALLAEAELDDARPLWVSVWGGAATLAEVLIEARKTRSPEQMEKLISCLRVYSISDQDDAGPWIRREFPKLFYIAKPSSPDSAEYASATWTGISGDVFYRNGAGADGGTVTNEWLDTNIRSKGPLGKHYLKFAFIMEGDTPSYLGLIPNGLNNLEHPDWGGWGGRYIMRQPYGESDPLWTQGGDSFSRVTSSDTVNGHTSDQATIWRWRTAYQYDFAARMDWTIKPFAGANHPPVVVVNGSASGAPLELKGKVGETLTLSAKGSSDPDGNKLSYRWFHYAEAGDHTSPPLKFAQVSISAGNTATAKVKLVSQCHSYWINEFVPCNPKSIGKAHVILAVTDNGKPTLTRYARVIISVEATPK